MNKDAMLATIIGLVLGLAIAGAFIFGPSLIKALPKIKIHFPTISLPKNAPKTAPQPTRMPNVSGITITAPLPEAVESKEDIIVSGVTQAGAVVVIQGPLGEDIVIAGQDGAYAGKIGATEGKNDVTATAYDADGKQTQATVTVYYTQEEFQ